MMSGEGKSSLELKKRHRETQIREVAALKNADRTTLVTWAEDTAWTTIDPTPYTYDEIPKWVYVLMQLHYDGSESDPGDDQDVMRAYAREDDSDETIMVTIEGYASYEYASAGEFSGYCRQNLAAFVKCSDVGRIEAMLETLGGDPINISFKIFLLGYI